MPTYEFYDTKTDSWYDLDSNEDCSSNYCNPFTSVCSIENACTKYQLYNCDFEECQNLGKNYHYDINGKCIDYSERENIKKKDSK